ncbi:DUF1048 domain-containing protein [uncultured Vagococcus sp.]|uniref:DUF1048 domain-containing protein n=1 Tax=uncultured Vagococcus sp. TaxID=189676 RepID=UPI0028D6A3BA|nr:DUF1048 domain-containing protein [uncultured Vagococcus sp.]
MKSHNIVDYFKQVRADKVEYKAHMARVKELPKEYQIVFEEVQKFLWQFTAGDGMDMMVGMYALVDFFEEGASNKIPILQLVGEDVGTFAESTLHEMQARTQVNELKRKMNQRIAKKLHQE